MLVLELGTFIFEKCLYFICTTTALSQLLLKRGWWQCSGRTTKLKKILRLEQVSGTPPLRNKLLRQLFRALI